MRRLRAAGERGLVRDDRGERRCAFSSGDFHDPGWTGWGALRVLNELRLEPRSAPPHARANMEELGYVLAGTLEPAARSGTGDAPLAAGALYWCGAGHGAEAAAAGWVAGPGGATVLQAWIQPDRVNAAPARASRSPAGVEPAQQCLASPDGAAGSLAMRQQAWLHSVRLPAGGHEVLTLDPGRRYWLQLLQGAVSVDDTRLAAGDGLAIVGEDGTAVLAAGGAGAVLLAFDLPR